MEQENLKRVNWFDALTQKFQVRSGAKGRQKEQLSDIETRTVLVAKTRWVLLLLIGTYGIFACDLYYFSSYGFFLTFAQLVFLLGSLCAVVAYNIFFQFFYEKVSSVSFVNQLQIFLDLLFATILIHFSGGAASWFWPVYLVVTIEAAFLLEQKRDVLFMVALVGGLFGALLTAEYYEMLPHVAMPFVNEELHHNLLYKVLVWCWVTILNATMAIIGIFLMSVIRRENQALRESEERLVSFLDSAHDLIHSNTPDGRFLYVNRAWQRTLGYGPEDISRISLFDIVHAESRPHCATEFNRILAGEKINPLEVGFTARDGSVVTVEGNMTCSFKDDEPVAVWGICRDITERKDAEEQLYRLAHHDILTGLPNRILFIDRLKQARGLAKRLKSKVAVLFLDLDRFKIINDTLGHSVGDQLLQQTAQRLIGCVREVDTVARIGGDEFTVILVNIRDAADVEKVAHKILKTLANPFTIDVHELFVTTSIGASIYPDDGENLENLVKKADIAMYHAKVQGRNNHQFYFPELDENAEKKLVLGNGLRKALEREEFLIHYQPKFDITTGKVTALEALLRWQHPELGLIYPADFIPLAEEMGLIIPIGEWVLRKACAQNKSWLEQGLPRKRVAVNLSGYQFQQKNLAETIRKSLEETGLDAELLELEITESVIMQNPELAVSVLCEMRDIGVHISIDDFGTGYSSLAHLKRFSVNTLKIDKSFVRDVEVSATDAAIATAIIAMGNCLDLKVIAEGVETVGQLSFLKENRCDEVQGFLFSGALPAEEIPAYLLAAEQRHPKLGEGASE